MFDLSGAMILVVLAAAALIVILISIGLAVLVWKKIKAQKNDNDELQEVLVHKAGTEDGNPTEVSVPAAVHQRYPVTLTPRQIDILEGEDWLEDDTIDAAQEILQKQFEADGLQSCVVAELGYKPVSGPSSVQIHHDEQRRHWFTSCFRDGRILIADSMYRSLSLEGKTQLIELYSQVALDPLDVVTFLDVDQQPNNSDCGLYAIANAYELLDGNASLMHAYENSVMRAHLAMCLQRGFFSQFPRKGC
ncbi:uncharacterized protein [Engystomops pustulosus]|uniref:uncharacterized protein isoform X2 n=1 Tax=Engystomops pustulosus TaxID=76066 RepID=UPI003AFA763D